MEQYIKKSAVKEKIESKKKYAQTLGDNAINGSMQQFYDGMKRGCVDITSSINTLEVKEMPDSDDLEQEIENELERTWYGEYLDTDKFKESAIYFYELGLKAKGK